MNRTRILAFLFLGIPFLVVCAAMVMFAINNADRVRPKPEMKSAFMTSYSPREITDRFDLHIGTSGVSDSNAAASGKGFATHRRTIDAFVVIRPQDAGALPKRLADEATTAIERANLRVLEQSRTPQDAYRIHYAGGAIDGTITIDPVKPDAQAQQRLRPSADQLPAITHIVIEEKWTKSPR